jgi:hypothetical protein
MLQTILFSDYNLVLSRVLGFALLIPTWQFWRGLHQYRTQGRPLNIVTLYQTAFITTLSIASIIGTHSIIVLLLVWVWWKKIGDWYLIGKLKGRLQTIRILLGCSCAFFLQSSRWYFIVIPLGLEAVYYFSLRYNSIYTNADGNV